MDRSENTEVQEKPTKYEYSIIGEQSIVSIIDETSVMRRQNLK